MQVSTQHKKEEIIFDNVSFHYVEDRPILENVSFTIRSGETFVIVGQCGFGKSTLLKLCCGLLKPCSGSVILRGRDTKLVSHEELHKMRLDIGYVFQNSALISNMPVGANIALPLRYHTDFSPAKIASVVKSRLELLELTGIEMAMPSSLSMGLMKRAAVARALALMPSLMLYDEPTSGLDPLNAASINGIISTLHKGFGVT
ncbi:MAG: ATP-binding cassette domain-containing protein, partial [Fibrobacteres bacterium]|nr:ATP-binding cassette domain-containing protein [Fibrobacterota bacterium]